MDYTTHTEDFILNFYNCMGIVTSQQLDYQEIVIQLGIRLFYWNDKSLALFIKESAYIFINEHLSKIFVMSSHMYFYILVIKDACLPFFENIRRTKQIILCIMPVSLLSCWIILIRIISLSSMCSRILMWNMTLLLSD